jgi:hypothetical protein
LHPVEGAWRRFRNSARGELLRRALKLQRNYLDFIGLKHPPSEIVLQGRQADRGSGSTNDSHSEVTGMFWRKMAAVVSVAVGTGLISYVVHWLSFGLLMQTATGQEGAMLVAFGAFLIGFGVGYLRGFKEAGSLAARYHDGDA